MAVLGFASLRHQRQINGKRRWDIIQFTLTNHYIGFEDYKRFFIFEVDLPDIEARLNEMLSVNPNPVLSYPYAIYDSENRMVVRSSKIIDASIFTARELTDYLNIDKHMNIKRINASAILDQPAEVIDYIRNRPVTDEYVSNDTIIARTR